jgi:hypothetical protein
MTWDYGMTLAMHLFKVLNSSRFTDLIAERFGDLKSISCMGQIQRELQVYVKVRLHVPSPIIVYFLRLLT